MKSQPSDTGRFAGTVDTIDVVNAELDRERQWRYRSYESDAAWVADEFAEFCRAEITSSRSQRSLCQLNRSE